MPDEMYIFLSSILISCILNSNIINFNEITDLSAMKMKVILNRQKTANG